MALDPATAKLIAKVVIDQITDEEKRQRLIIGIIIAIVVFVFVLMIPIFAITSTIDKIKSYFTFDSNGKANDSSYYSLIDLNETYSPLYVKVGELEIGEGTLPMPVKNAKVTSEFGTRVHPITGKVSFHTGIDLAGAWRSEIMNVYAGKVVFAGVKVGYGNCVQIYHATPTGTEFYTLYAHLARIDVVPNQMIQAGTVIGLQGGDPRRDPNPRI